MANFIVGYCPVPKCEHKNFQGESLEAVRALIREHIKANLEDQNHSDIADMEGWLDPVPDPLGD